MFPEKLMQLRSAVAVIYFCLRLFLVPWLYILLLATALIFPIISLTRSQTTFQIGISASSLIIGALYTLYWVMDLETPYRGGNRREWMRRAFTWRWISEYFPIRMIPSAEFFEEYGKDGSIKLPNSVNYLLGYHPHGPIAIGALIAFSTDAVNFSSVFPGIKSYFAILDLHFKIPIHRDLSLLGGVISVKKSSLQYVLDPEIGGEVGNLVAVSVGGATEALESRPGIYNIQLLHKYGFFKMALTTGAHLMPCIGFGETGIFDQVRNPPNSILRLVQEWLTKKMTISLPLFYSRNILPYRVPINIVIGKHIPCQKVANPTEKQVTELRKNYMQLLSDLFFKYRPLYDPKAEDIRFT